MAQADAYKVLADTTIPRALRHVEDDEIVGSVYETEGINYPAGSYVLARDIDPNTLRQVEAGEKDHLLEAVSGEEAEAAFAEAERAGRFSTFIPEHENEAHIQQQYGHTVIPRQQEIELRSQGAEAVAAAQEELKSDGADERPGLTAAEVPSLVEASNEGKVVAADAEPVAVPAGTEQPPGIPVGADLAASRGADEDEKPKRSRPTRRQQSSDEGGSDDGSNDS